MKSLSILAAAALVSCHAMTGASTIHLTETSLYDIDSVRLATAGGDPKEAGKILDQATETLRNDKDTVKGIMLFKSSIIREPTARAYFELAGALLSTRQYDEGLEALSMAEKLGYSPMANVMFRYAYAYANKPVDAGALPNRSYVDRYMELAIQMGYAHPGQFLQKDLFPTARRNHDYDVVFTNALSGGSLRDPAKPLWDSYEGQFPEVPLPLVIDLPWIQHHELDITINFQYEKFIPDMRDAKFSREGGTTYFFVASIHKDQNFVALLYGEVDDMVEGDESQLPQFTLVTYDRQGKLIDRMAVAGRKLLSDPFQVFSIHPDLKFRVQEFKDIYRDDPDSAGYKNNQIIRRDAGTPKDFQITANGKFQPTDAPLARR
jgi:hypothetical protein